MAGSAIGLKFDTEELEQHLAEIAERMGDTAPALAIIGETVTASARRNFEVGGRPHGWQELKPATLKRKNGRGSTLVGAGFGGGLLGSIHFEVEKDAVYIGTNKIYGATHQYGDSRRNIPARLFLLIQDEDVPEINAALNDFIIEGE